MATNISKVYLLNTPLEDDMKNTLYFADDQAQHSYFVNTIGRTFNNVSYQSETRTFRCPEHIDKVRQYNYMMWQNTAYSNKWFYAFIKEMVYVSDGYTDVIFEVDPLQTYMFDISVRPSFVEREHTNNDTVGNNTQPENVELGPYVKNSTAGTLQYGPDEMFYCVGVSDIVGSLTYQPSSIVNGLPNGLYYIFTPYMSTLHNIVEIYDDAGKANAIYTMFVMPKQLLYLHPRSGDTGSWAYRTSTWSYTGASSGFTASFDVYVPNFGGYDPEDWDLTGRIMSDLVVPIPQVVGQSYTPRNKKLLTFPYCYFNISNNTGTTVTYHYEDFKGTPKFNLDGVICAGCSTKFYPTNYRNMNIFTGDLQDNSYDYGVTGGKYPTISWNSDSYTNWLTQNAVNIGIGVGSTVLSTVAGLGMGNVGGAVASFVGGVSNAVSQVYEASLIPDQAKGNTNVGDLNYTAHKNKFTVYPLSIKPEYAEIIDDYFDLFGYKTNRVKVPYVAHRQTWWYTKTINANITGNIPNDELNKIKDAYNNGLTFWRDASNFLNYGVSNGVVS